MHKSTVMVARSTCTINHWEMVLSVGDSDLIMLAFRHRWLLPPSLLCLCLLFTGCGDGGAGKNHHINEIIRRGMQERMINTWAVVQEHMIAGKRKSTDPECATHDHPVYGCTGRCMFTADCPGGKDSIVNGLCQSQPYDIRCCFTANTTKECATFDDFIHGKTGHCTKTSKCPDANYLSDLCPEKGDDVECCYSKPVDNCPLSLTDESFKVPEDCLRCMRDATFNHTTGKDICQYLGNGERVCGPFMLNEEYWEEAASSCTDIGDDWFFCAHDYECSKITVQAYMKLHATRQALGHQPTCEDFARIHKGGPQGHQQYSTLAFWGKVKDCLDRT